MEHARPCPGYAHMKHMAQEELSRIMLRYASDESAMRQLRRLPSFDVPQDSHAVFADLLDRLDHAQQEGRKTPGSC